VRLSRVQLLTEPVEHAWAKAHDDAETPIRRPAAMSAQLQARPDHDQGKSHQVVGDGERVPAWLHSARTVARKRPDAATLAWASVPEWTPEG
jgi:hypothetical protein